MRPSCACFKLDKKGIILCISVTCSVSLCYAICFVPVVVTSTHFPLVSLVSPTVLHDHPCQCLLVLLGVSLRVTPRSGIAESRGE